MENRSPDAVWIPQARWDALSKEERKRFLPLCPDFVVELRSPSDTIQTLQKKMCEYMDNGARLGWLIDPQTGTVEVYRQGQDAETLGNPTGLSCEAVLPGFVLDMTKVWG
jgi:Uma2 family endonuclease